jgi:hypothetical protein
MTEVHLTSDPRVRRFRFLERAEALVDPGRSGGQLTLLGAKHLLETMRGDRLEGLWVCALSLGLRRGELLGIRWATSTYETVAVR